MKSIVRRDTGEGYQKMLERLAEESGIRTPTRAELIAFDRKRLGKSTANKDWQSSTDEDARIGKLKDGRTHMAYRPEHVVDLESGAVVSAVIHPADRGDTTTLATTLDDARAKLCAVRDKEDAPGIDEPFALVADKGCHSRKVLKDLPDACTSRISEPGHKGRLCWHGDRAARDAVYGNRKRLGSSTGKALMRARGERVERSFAHCLDRGGMRRFLLLARVADKTAASFNAGLISCLRAVPSKLRQTLTLDNGSEMAGFRALEAATGLRTYFCKPHAPWQRGTNENSNGLLRQYFPRGISFHKITEAMVVKAAEQLNNRPRKCLHYQTPAELFNQALIGAFAI